MACTRGIGVDAFCSLEPQTPGCSSPVDPLRETTVSKYMVDVILRVHKPSHSVGIFEGSTEVPKELQASMQTSMSVLNYADPDMTVNSVQVELANDGKEKIPLVHVTISTSTFENAKQLAKILSESSTVQKDFMGKSLTDAFHATNVSGTFYFFFCASLSKFPFFSFFLESKKRRSKIWTHHSHLCFFFSPSCFEFYALSLSLRVFLFSSSNSERRTSFVWTTSKRHQLLNLCLIR
jgi:hypothetical protein